MLAGVYALDAGSVTVSAAATRPHALRRLPIAFIHQDLGLIEWMTVAENICLDARLSAPLRHWSTGAARTRAAAALETLGADIDPDPRVQRSAAPRNRWSPSPARWPPTPKCWCSTSRPPACRPTRWRGCSPALRRLRDARRRHDLRLAPARRGVRDRRPHGRAARRPRRRRAAGRRDDAGGGDPADRRPRAARRCSAGRRQRQGTARLVLRAARRSTASGRSTARSTPARSSASSACAAPGRRAVGRALFGLTPPIGGRDPARRRTRSRRVSPRQAMACRHQPRLRATASANRSCRACRCARTCSSIPTAAGLPPFSLLSPAAREPRRRCELGARVGLRPNDPGAADRGAVRRQPAEGRGRPLAASRRPSSTSSRIRPPASMSAPRPRSTGCSTSRCRPGAAILIVSTDFEEVAKVCHRALVFDRGRVVAELAGARPVGRDALLAAASASIGSGLTAAAARVERHACSRSSRTRSSRRAPNSRASAAAERAAPAAAGLRPADPDACC